MTKGKTILITGGCGFIGTHLTGEISKHNKIILFDTNKNIIQNTSLLKEDNVKFIKGDVLNTKQVDKVLKGVDVVIHMASIAHVENIYKDPYMNMYLSLQGTKNIVDSCLKHKVKKLVYTSTSEVYGPYAFGVTEDLITKQGSNKDLRWTYSAGKVCAEHVIQWGHEKGLDTTIIRPFNIFGSGQNSGVIFQMVRKSYDREITVNGDGSQVRAFCHISDFVEATKRILRNKKSKGKTYNIGNPNNAITMQEMAYKIKNIMGITKLKITNKVYEGEDVEVRVPSIKNIEKDMRWKPKINLHHGLTDYIRWFKGMVEQAKK